MKKTFQKELKTGSSGKNHDYQQNGEVDDSISGNSSQDRKTSFEFIGPTPSTTAVSTSKSKLTSKTNYSTMLSTRSIDDTLSTMVDLTYLKHVIFKFLTSREYEVRSSLLIKFLVLE